MPLLKLPNELLHAIGDHVEEDHDLNSLQQVNKFFNILYGPMLRERALAERNGLPALVSAAREGRLAHVRYIIHNVPNINIDESTPNILARQAGGGDITLTGSTALICASGRGHANVVRELINRGADVNAYGEVNTCTNHNWTHGVTALQLAALAGHIDTVRILLANGAMPEQAGIMRVFNPATRAIRMVFRTDAYRSALLNHKIDCFKAMVVHEISFNKIIVGSNAVTGLLGIWQHQHLRDCFGLTRQMLDDAVQAMHDVTVNFFNTMIAAQNLGGMYTS